MTTLDGNPEHPWTVWPLEAPKRSRLVVAYDEEVGMVLVVRRTQRARHEYECAECEGAIYVGEMYVYEWQVLDGDGVTIRRHLTACPF
jgi:hypothetical protein